MSDGILVINGGSTSVKFAAYRHHGGDALSVACRGQVEGIGSHPSFVAKGADGNPGGKCCRSWAPPAEPGRRTEVHL